jgi:transposase
MRIWPRCRCCALPADRLPTPRADDDREALRILLGASREMTVTKTKQINRLRALLLGGDDIDRDLSRGTLTETKLQAIARRRGRPNDTAEQAVRRAEARRLSIAIRTAIAELADNKRQLAALVGTLAPALLDKTGVGHVSAAQAIVSWSHHGRCRNDAAFAALAGSSPIPASSGRIVRHRLNRALHDITLTRWRPDLRTHAYIAGRRAAGKSDTEIHRALKRHVARELFRVLEATPAA